MVKSQYGPGNSIQSMGEARTKLLMMTMDHTGFRPFLKHMMLLNTYYLDPKSEVRINTPQGEGFTPMFAGDLHPEFDFSAPLHRHGTGAGQAVPLPATHAVRADVGAEPLSAAAPVYESHL